MSKIENPRGQGEEAGSCEHHKYHGLNSVCQLSAEKKSEPLDLRILRTLICQVNGVLACELLQLLPDVPRRSIFRALTRLLNRRMIRCADNLLMWGRGRPARQFYVCRWVREDPAAALMRPRKVSQRVTLNVALNVALNPAPIPGETPDPITYRTRTRPPASYPEREEKELRKQDTDRPAGCSADADMRGEESQEIEELMTGFEIPTVRAVARRDIASWLAGEGKPEDLPTPTIADIKRVCERAIAKGATSWGWIHGNREYTFWDVYRELHIEIEDNRRASERQEHRRGAYETASWLGLDAPPIKPLNKRLDDDSRFGDYTGVIDLGTGLSRRPRLVPAASQEVGPDPELARTAQEFIEATPIDPPPPETEEQRTAAEIAELEQRIARCPEPVAIPADASDTFKGRMVAVNEKRRAEKNDLADRLARLKAMPDPASSPPPCEVQS